MTAYLRSLLKTGLNCLHNFFNEKRHYIKSGVEKDILHLVEDLGRVMAKYKATYHIHLASSPQHLKQRKGKNREKKGEEEARSLWKQEKKSMPYFPFSGRNLPPPPPGEDFEPHIFGIPQLETFSETLQYLKDRQGMLALPLQGKLFRQGSPGDCLGLLHLRVNELTTVL